MPCPPCAGRGRVDAWLEVEEERSWTTLSSPENRLSASLAGHRARAANGQGQVHLSPAFQWRGSAQTLLSDGETASDPLLWERPATPADKPDDATLHARALVSRHGLFPTIEPPGERLGSAVVQRFESHVWTLHCQLFGSQGALEITEWDGSVVEGTASARPFQRHRGLLAAGVGSLTGLGLLLAGWYSSRHLFFVSSLHGLVLWLLALVSGLAVLPFARRLSLPGKPTRQRALFSAAVPALLALACQIVLAATGGPQVEHARNLAQQGATDRALVELSACVTLGREPEAAARLHDELLLRQLALLNSPVDAWRLVGSRFLTEHGRAEAANGALALTLSALDREAQAGNLDGVDFLVRSLPPGLGSDSRVRAARALAFAQRALACVDRHSGSCLEGTLARARQAGFQPDDLEPLAQTAYRALAPEVEGSWRVLSAGTSTELRQAACTRIREPLALLELACSGLALPTSTDAVERRCRALDREVEAAQARKARLLERQQEQRERAWATAPLLCRDGTLSPSCICGGSHRGCCSHHGGVAGCSQD